jgi:hypothetical protein
LPYALSLTSLERLMPIWGDVMSLLLIIVVLVLLFGGGGSYYGYNRGYYGGRGHGLIWLIVIVVVLVLLFGGGHFGGRV